MQYLLVAINHLLSEERTNQKVKINSDIKPPSLYREQHVGYYRYFVQLLYIISGNIM